jgi:poly-gamma-glutamate synthesis protein (capsule biosynthesis protein)
MDWGREGIETTISILDDLGIVHVGAGLNREKAEQPKLFDSAGYRIGLLGFCKKGEFSAGRGRSGSAVFRDRTVRRSIDTVRGDVDFLILSLHTGFEFCSHPTPALIKQCREYVRLGVDLVLCHHAHVLQAVEQFENGVIAYNLGNFMFDSNRYWVFSDSAWRQRHSTIILEAALSPGGIPSLRIIPAVIDDDGLPGKPSNEQEEYIRDSLQSFEKLLGTLSEADVYELAMKNLYGREVKIYRKLLKDKGLRFLWSAIRSFKFRHVKMLLVHFWRKFFKKKITVDQ